MAVAKIVEQAAADTASRVDALHFQAIQDTTSFRDEGSVNSLVGHATIAVEAEHGSLFELVDTRIIQRDGGAGKVAKNRPLHDKQSQRWIDGLQASAGLTKLGTAQVTVVADREGDIYEMFADSRPAGVYALVRAVQDRGVAQEHFFVPAEPAG